MALRGTTLAVLAAIAGLSSVACGGSDDPSKTTDDNTAGTGGSGGGGGNTATETCDPTAEIPCFKDMAEPCENYDSGGWEGDELCIKPPNPGIQLHVGPSDYTDPDEVSKYVLPPGGFAPTDPGAAIFGTGPDVNWCYYMKAPNDETIFTDRYFSRMRPGSHHFIMFGQKGDVPDSTGPQDCSGRNGAIAGGANFLAGATRSIQNATMFGDAPEDAGLGSEGPPHQQLNMNLHFVNITDGDVLMELWVNMIQKPADQVTDRVYAMEWLGGLGMNIPPGAHQLVASTECQAPLEDTRILGVTAHDHANTVRVSMFQQKDGSATKDLVFHDFNWEEPTVWLFNSTYKNASPDLASKRAGAAFNGDFYTNPRDKFTWECEVINKQTVSLSFSDKAYEGEMCNVFGMYSSPVASAPWSCFSLGGGVNIQ